MITGAQLYTVRDYCKTPEDFSETLKKIADIGYTTVQVSGTCAYEGEWLANELRKTGLSCVLTHYDGNKTVNNTDFVIDEHKKFGCKYIGIGGIPGFLSKHEDYENFVKNFRGPAGKIASAGLYFMYHNHHIEFMKAPSGRLYIEELADAFPASEMGFTLDTYWIQYGGANPTEWINRLKGRVPCIHLKDFSIVNREIHMAVIGEGNINFNSVLSAAESAGTEYLLVEQDTCYGENPFDCLKRSHDYLKSLGLK